MNQTIQPAKMRFRGRDHTARSVDDGIQYARDIISGVIVSCAWVRKSCERFLSDLDQCEETGELNGLPTRFNRDRAQDILNFFLAVPHVKGRLAGHPIGGELMGWHNFILINLFGFQRPLLDELTGEHVLEYYDPITRKPTEVGHQRWVRRFKTANILVARKNAKSTISSGIALFLMTRDTEGGAEVYSAATTRDQARIVFGDAQKMVRKSPSKWLKDRLKVHKFAITNETDDGVFSALSADANSLDGLNVHGAIVDELHAHKSREVWDVLETATGSRDQSLIVAISTAGTILDGICVEQQRYGRGILDGHVTDDSYFTIEYCLDDEDDRFDTANWIKANPGLGVCKRSDDMQRLAIKAKQMPTARANFFTKHLNLFVNGADSWLNIEAWDACPDTCPDEDIVNCMNWIGLDLANKRDIAAAIKLSREYNSGAYDVRCKFFLPEDRLDEISTTQANMYRTWSDAGYLTLTPGNVIDHDYIKDDLTEWIRDYPVSEIAYDPWGSTQLAVKMELEGAPMVQVGQSTRNFSEAMKEVEKLVLSKKLRHGGNPVLRWMASNVVAKLDARENVYPLKTSEDKKIDGMIGLFMAMNRAIADDTGDLNSLLNDEAVIV